MTVRRSAAVSWLLIVLALLAACAPRFAVEFVAEGGSYSSGDLDARLAAADLESAARLAAENVPDARQEALASLRRHGEDAAALADSLTSDFPLDAASVPVIAERGHYDGAPAWIVIEAWGDAGGELSHRSIWVFSRDTHDVIAVRSAP